MADVSKIIEGALQEITVVAQRETPSTEDASLGLERLNSMLGDWIRRGVVTNTSLPLAATGTIDEAFSAAVRFNLALHLAPAFGKSARAELTQMAQQTFSALMTRSSPPAPDYEENTWGWLMTDGLVRAGVIQEGMLPSIRQANRAYRYFIRLTEAWTLDGMLNHTPFHIEPFVVPAGEGKLIYTIGADDDADIPVRSLATIQSLSIRYYSQNGWERVLRPVDWDTIVNHTRFDLAGTWPTLYYYEAAWPVGCIYFNIRPTAGTIINIAGRADWLDEGTLTGPITLPEGYEDAVSANLAIRLAEAYRLPVTQFMYKDAKDSLKLLRKRNYRGRLSVLPRALQGMRYGTYYGSTVR